MAARKKAEHKQNGADLKAVPKNPKKGVELINAEGREHFDMQAMHAAFSSDISSLLSKHALYALNPYGQVLREVDALGIEGVQITVDPSFLVKVMLNAYDIFPLNKELPPYSKMDVPEHWLTNWQCKLAYFEYLKVEYRGIAEQMWHKLLEDAKKTGTEPSRRRPNEFHSELEKAQALTLDDVALNHVSAIDRYFCSEQAGEVLTHANLRLIRRLDDGDVIYSGGHRKVSKQHNYIVLNPKALRTQSTE